MARQPNIEAAIRRSRGARAKRQSRRRRWYAIAAVSATLGGAGIVSLNALTGNDMLHAAVARAQSLSELFNERSPGERTSAQLTKTKHARALAKSRPHVAVPPAQSHELARILMPPRADVPLELAPPFPTASLILPPPVSGFMAPGSGGGGAIVSQPGGGAIIAPPGGGGITPPGGGTEVTPNEPREPVPSAVPEPSTWALMLLGFGLVGWRSRRTRSAVSLA